MSYDEINGFGYDEYQHDDDLSSYSDILDNRAYRAGEVVDTKYPLSNMRGGYKYVGSGPMIGDIVNEQKKKIESDQKLLQENGIKAQKIIEKLENQKTETKPKSFILEMLDNSNLLIILVVILICLVYMQYTQMNNFINTMKSLGLHKLLMKPE